MSKETPEISNLGKWDRWYAGIDEPQTYGDTVTYEIGRSWLQACDVVYDWGCGKGGFQLVSKLARYEVRGIDGSATPFAYTIMDLVDLKHVLGPAEAVVGHFMRHVLEHDYRWQHILTNFLDNISYRGVLVLFTPMQPYTHEIAWNEDPGVPDIGFRKLDVVDPILERDLAVTSGTYKTITQYGEETVFLIEKKR